MPCPLCDDTGWKPIDENGVRRVVRCDCWRDSVGRQRLDEAQHPETLPALHARQLHRLQRIARARGRARRTVCATRFRSSPRGCFSRGSPASARRTWPWPCSTQVIQTTGARGLFYDTRDLLRVIRSTYDPSIRTTEIDVLRPVMTADLLVLDDLGAEKTSEWVEETMNLIVNTRYNERRADDLHVQLPGHSGRHRAELAAVPDRPSDAVAAARDVRVRRSLDGARLPRVARQRRCRRPDDAVEDRKRGRRCRLPAAPVVQARAQLREPAARDGKADLKWPGGRAGS